jgi:hypothetical protein
MPRKQGQGAAHARDETECRCSQPYAYFLPELRRRTKIAEFWMKVVGGKLR